MTQLNSAYSVPYSTGIPYGTCIVLGADAAE
eukprot:COSAG02_NODE_27235_length_614_cov_0.900971_1_plen_30_part_10